MTSNLDDVIFMTWWPLKKLKCLTPWPWPNKEVKTEGPPPWPWKSSKLWHMKDRPHNIRWPKGHDPVTSGNIFFLFLFFGSHRYTFVLGVRVRVFWSPIGSFLWSHWFNIRSHQFIMRSHRFKKKWGLGLGFLKSPIGSKVKLKFFKKITKRVSLESTWRDKSIGAWIFEIGCREVGKKNIKVYYN